MMLPLFAAVDWLEVIAPIAIVLFLVLRQILTGVKAAQPQQRPRQAGRPASPVQRTARPPSQTTPPAPGKPASTQTQLNAEIEQFLRRANDRRAQQAKAESAGKPASGKTSSSKSLAPPPPRQAREQTIESAERRPIESVTASVQKHLDNSAFSQRAERLADDIVRVDQQMEDHLKKAFDRRVGTLGPGSPAGVPPVTDAAPEPTLDTADWAREIQAALSSPNDVRKAVVLNMILQRPETSW